MAKSRKTWVPKVLVNTLTADMTNKIMPPQGAGNSFQVIKDRTSARAGNVLEPSEINLALTGESMGLVKQARVANEAFSAVKPNFI